MKKVFALAMSIFMVTGVCQSVFAKEITYTSTELAVEIAQEDKIQVDKVSKMENTTLFYSGDEVKLENDILNIEGRSYLPLEIYEELFDVEIDWNKEYKIAVVRKDNKVIEIPINHNRAVVTEQGKSTVKDMDDSNPKVVAFIYQSRTYVPLQFFGQQMNYGAYYWQGKNGNAEIYVRDENNIDNPFTYINQPLDIDCANHDVSALTEYLAQNVKGFDKEKCRLELISQSSEHDEYTILYYLTYKGFDTPYSLLANTEGKMVHYVSDLHEFDLNAAKRVNLMHADDIPDDIVEKAKAVAVDKNLPEGYGVKEQKVTKRLDENFKPYLSIVTVYYDEIGAMYAKEYQLYLD